MTTRALLDELKTAYSQLVIYDDKTAMLPVGIDTEFRIDAEKPVKDWVFWNSKEKAEVNKLALSELMKTMRQDVSEVWHDIKERAGNEKPKDPIDNLKDGGFEGLPEQEEPKPEPKVEQTGWKVGGKSTVKQAPTKHTKALAIPEDIRSKQISALTQDDIKSYLCPTASDQETYLFLQLCQARNLNPFLNEAYLIKYGNKATMVVGKETFTRRAEQHPQFDGFEAGIIVQTENGLEEREGTFILKNENLLGGYAKVYRKDRTRPIISKVPLAEYDSGQSLWKTKPGTMIRKVALVQALRESFACELSGMYDASEVDVIDAIYEVH